MPTDDTDVPAGHGTIGSLLDALVAAWEARGVDVRSTLHQGPPVADVQHRFAELGIDPVPELVELYAWRRPEDYPGLFWEADLFGIDQAVEVWRANRSVIEGHPDWERDAEELMSWPGPTTFFPALIGVGNSGDCLMVDNSAGPDRGGLWWVVTQDDSRKVFESLDEALRAAIHCVSEALWTRDGAVVECLRTHQPWPHDRVHPPWCDEHH